MPPPTPVPDPYADVRTDIIAGITGQLRDLQPTLDNLVEIAGLSAELQHLATLVIDPTLTLALTAIVASVNSIQSGVKPGTAPPNVVPATITDFGDVLLRLYNFQPQLQAWLTAQTTMLPADQTQLISLLSSAITQVRQLLNYRPDVGAVMDDLAAVKALQGGPADATAFHDFSVLNLAFRSVWMHAFSADLQNAAGTLYGLANTLYEEAGQPPPDPGAIEDVQQLNDFVNGLADVTGVVAGDGSTAPLSPLIPPPPSSVVTQPGFDVAVNVWALLSNDQRNALISNVQKVNDLVNGTDTTNSLSNYDQVGEILDQVKAIAANPQGTAARLVQVINEIGVAQEEPYAFDVFAPDSYNYGLIVTYRQIWEPGPYQAGDLVSTIPLAPGETRKYSRRQVVKETVSRRTAQKSTESRSTQSSEASRAERDILERATSATNFQITTNGSFNIGIGSLSATSEIGGNTSSESTQSKKDFHEATLKAAEDYRQERSLEIDTSTSIETEETTSGEISNPNNEITVTYLFYELQRRYQIREFLYRVRPVILIAQDVPSPEQVDEAWLIQYQWIIARVLLDDSLRPALTYLSSGFAGDVLSVAVLETQWKTQAALVSQLEALVQQQLTARYQMRSQLVDLTQEKDSIPEMPGVLNLVTWGINPSDPLKNELKAQIKAGESRLKYAEQALADAQDKLQSASNAYQQATKDYSAALQNQYSRQVAVDQLRIHVKQNILYYMQAIWAHEVPDQRFFRLYNKKVLCPAPRTACEMRVNPGTGAPGIEVGGKIPVDFNNVCVPGTQLGEALGGELVDLSSVADLDNPLGYKGNYIIFPLVGECSITDYMLTDYVNEYLGVQDPDGTSGWDAEVFDDQWQDAVANGNVAKQATLKAELLAHIEEINNQSDEIIVPTGQLFIEALPGSHPLLENFKLVHRDLDLVSVQAQNRRAELENLRLAARLAADPPLLQDPDIDKRIVVDKGVGVVMDSNP